MQRIAVQYSRVPLPFSEQLMDACLHYALPGNLRELQNFIKRYLVMADEAVAMRELRANQRRKPVSVAGFSELRVPPAASAQDSSATPADRARDLKFLVRNLKDETEIHAITRALAETNWNRKKAARLLHISYRNLLYKIVRHGITRMSQPDLTNP